MKTLYAHNHLSQRICIVDNATFTCLPKDFEQEGPSDFSPPYYMTPINITHAVISPILKQMNKPTHNFGPISMPPLFAPPWNKTPQQLSILTASRALLFLFLTYQNQR